MSRKPKILVTSAAGKTGLPTALQLLEKGYPVRALVRREDHRSHLLKDAGAEVFVGDQYVLADMLKAMDGVQRAYHCAPAAPNGLHFSTVFSVAAFEQRIEHVVLLGQWLSHAHHPSQYTREVFLSEAVTKLLPDATFTINNVGWFADNYFMVLESVAQLGLLPMPLGDGSVKKNAPPSNEDIASVSVGALIDPAVHAGKIYRPTGPELLSPDEIAKIMGDVLGRRVAYRDISERMLGKAMVAQGFNIGMITQLRHYADEYRRGAFAVNAPTNAVREVGGREPKDFAAIAARIIAERPEAQASIGNRLKALSNFARLLMTPAPDFDAVERERDHVLIRGGAFAREDDAWRRTHDPDAGFVPDSPMGGHNSGAANLRTLTG